MRAASAGTGQTNLQVQGKGEAHNMAGLGSKEVEIDDQAGTGHDGKAAGTDRLLPDLLPPLVQPAKLQTGGTSA